MVARRGSAGGTRQVGIRERQERDRQGVRRAILDAARELFVAEGYANVSMRKIAERIGSKHAIMLSLALAHFSGQIDMSKLSWLWFTAFVGANLFQSGFTRLCPLEPILAKLGVKRQAACQ